MSTERSMFKRVRCPVCDEQVHLMIDMSGIPIYFDMEEDMWSGSYHQCKGYLEEEPQENGRFEW